MQVDLTRVELEGVLPSATIMVVTVTASTTAGLPLSENAVTKVCKPFCTPTTRNTWFVRDNMIEWWPGSASRTDHSRWDGIHDDYCYH